MMGMVQRDLVIISYLVHTQGGQVVVPAHWQTGEVSISEDWDEEDNPILTVTVKGAGPAPKMA